MTEPGLDYDAAVAQFVTMFPSIDRTVIENVIIGTKGIDISFLIHYVLNEYYSHGNHLLQLESS